MKKTIFYTILILVFAALYSCDDDNGTKVENRGEFAIAATSGEADYLLQTTTIDEGSTTILGNGIENTGTRNWMFYRNTAYSFIYSQGDPGKSTSFVLNSEGLLEKRSEFELPVSITTRGYYDEYIVVANSTRTIESPKATFYFFDVDNERTVGPFNFDTEELAGNGEMAYFTDIAQVGDKIYAPYKCIAGTGSTNATRMKVSIFDTLWIAVFNFDKTTETMTYEKTITHTGKTSFVAGQTSSQAETGISQVSNGDTYIFSSAPIDDSADSKNLPSGVLRINRNTEVIDESYFFNIQEKADNHHLYRVWYMGNTTFALQMYGEANSTSASAFKFAVVDVARETFSWVTGMPDVSQISSVGKPYVNQNENYIAFGITTLAGETTETHIYKINTNTATATKGIQVISNGVSGIGRLTY